MREQRGCRLVVCNGVRTQIKLRHLSTDQVTFNSYGAGMHVKGATDFIGSRLQNTVELERVSDCCCQPVDRNLAFCLFLQEPREFCRYTQSQLKRSRFRHRNADRMSKGIRVKRMFSGNSGHQILQGRVNNVWLESPNDKIPGHVFLICTMYGRDKSREPSVSDYHKPLVVLSLIDSFKNNRFAVFSSAQHQTRKGIFGA